MKKILLVLSLFICFAAQAQKQSLNISLLAHWNDSTLNRCDADQIWNDLTGWNDTIKKREYLIAGSCDSIYFFDITIDSVIKKCDVKEGHSRNSINRDYETYSHYVYCVSDRSSPVGSLQIFDLQYLPDSVHLVYDNDSLSVNTHTIFIEAKSKRAYLCSNIRGHMLGSSAMGILSLANPEHPVFIGELPVSSPCNLVHEVFVQNDTAYCSCGYNGLFIYDFKNAGNPIEIGSISPGYPYGGYNHSSWIDSTGKYLLFSDELPFGMPIKIYNIHDIQNPVSVKTFNSNIGATPHNADWKGRFAWTSSYEDGVYCYDLKDTANPVVAGYYDTYMKNPPGSYFGFHGCWGVYCFLPSGKILASDISEGLFVLKPSANLGINTFSQDKIHYSIYPNPLTENTIIKITSTQNEDALLSIFDVVGNVLIHKTIQLANGENEIDLNELNAFKNGMYFVQIKTISQVWNTKLMKQ